MKTIDMSNPNVLACSVLDESPFGQQHGIDRRVVVPADLRMTVSECREFLLGLGYEHKQVGPVRRGARL